MKARTYRMSGLLALSLGCHHAGSGVGAETSSVGAAATTVAGQSVTEHAIAVQPSEEREPGFHEVHVGDSDPSRYLSEESTGVRQSPINILTYLAEEGKHAVRLHYQTSKEHVTNLGHTVEVEMDPGSTLEFDGKLYELAQFHFHTPSEHLLDGVTYPMELHLVHTLRGDPTHYLVVGVLFREGPANALLATLLKATPGEAGVRVDVEDVKLDAASLFANSEHYFHYEGSLTTPPYSESVTWLLLKRIHTASPQQIGSLNTIEGNNARHIQQLKSRVVDSN